jgi:hypothetical protein
MALHPLAEDSQVTAHSMPALHLPVEDFQASEDHSPVEDFQATVNHQVMAHQLMA